MTSQIRGRNEFVRAGLGTPYNIGMLHDGDPSALQSFLEEGDNLKNSPSTSLDDSPLQVDFCIRTNGTHIRTSPTLLKQAAAAAVVAGGINSFQVSATQTVSSGINNQVVCSTQAPSPAYQQPVASPQVGHSPLNSHNATPTSSVQSPAPSPFSVPSRSPAQPIPCPSPSTHQPPPSQSPASLYQNKSPVHAPSPQSKSPVIISSPQQPAVVQFVSTSQPILPVQNRNVKPIQPKQPHLLPKPAQGTANGMQFANTKVNARNHPVSVAPTPQQNQYQQTATMLPNANMTMTSTTGGTLLLNHHILGLAQNPILIQGNAGGIQNLQLLVRPQQTSGQSTAQTNQNAANQTALLAALQVQNQAAQQALINHNKGQTMVIPTNANLIQQQQQQQQQQNALGKPTNMIMNTARMMNSGQQIQLQQIQTPQGPITLAITPQQLRGIQTMGATVLQGVTLSQAQLQGGASLPAGVMLNRQQQQQHNQSVKAPSVNLEELLKQAGIVPADTRPNPVLTSQAQNVVVSQSQQAVLINSGAISTSRANSQLITQLQQPIPLAQSAQAQQVKLSIAQDGSVYLQRPLVTMAQTSAAPNQTDTQSVLMQRLNAAGAQQIQIPVSSTSGVDTNSPLLPLTVQNINLSTASPQTALLTISSNLTNTTSTSSTSLSSLSSSDMGLTTMSGLIHANPTLVQSLSAGGGQLAAQHSVLAQALSQKTMASVPHQTINASQQVDHVTSTATATITTTAVSITQPMSTATIPNGAAVIKTETTNVLLTSAPITAIPAGQKLQTIQLSPQNQENLQKIQTQLRNLLSQKTHTPQQRQMIQQLQTTQQKILAQGKVISIQQAPANTLQLIQQPATLRPTTTTVNVSPKNNINATGNVHLSNLLKQAPGNVKTTNVSNSTSATVAAATVTVPGQIKVGNQLMTLSPQQRQTFQQLQQQLKALTPEQQQIYLAQNKQAVILKLQQQTQPTTVTSVSVGQPTPIAPAPPGISVANTGGLLVIQTIGKGIAQVKSIVPAIVQDQQNRGVKRPAPTPATQGTPIQQELTVDQNGALKPDCKTPFRSVKDACRRLLKYHVFNSKTPTPAELRNADKQFETVSGQLLLKARKVFSTYRCLLLKESVRQHPSAEVLMLNKLFVEDEKIQLENDKEDVKQGKDLNLPPLPEHWRHKMDAVSEDSKMSVCVATTLATTLASTCANTVTTTVHTAPLSSPSSKNKSRDYDEWAEIQKELEMYDDVTDTRHEQVEVERPERAIKEEVVDDDVMDADWDDVYNNRTRLSESEAAVESILMPLSSANTDVDLTDIDEFEPSYAASDSGGGKSDQEDDEDDDVDPEEEEKSPLSVPVKEELNAQVESAINSILHLQQKEEFDEFMDGEEYELEEEDEKDKNGILGVVNEHVSMEYDAGAAISLDTQEMDAALEEAVKSIM